jgi:beta-1,4-mannosyltransferase
MYVLAQPAFNNRHFNPYNWLLYTGMQKLGIPVAEFSPRQLFHKPHQVWHLHWPELVLNDQNGLKAFIKAQILLLQLRYAKIRGTKIVWTVHNLGSHNRFHPRLEHWFWNAFTHQLDAYISLSEGGIDAAQSQFSALKSIPGFVIPHGHYRGEYPNSVTPQAARAALGIPNSKQVILFFGRIRPYKNVPNLLRAFRQLSDPDVMLVVAGMPDTAITSEIQEIVNTPDARIKLQLEFIATEDTQLYFQAADLVVLPYREILNSGSALLSLSFNCPILVPDRGAMGELQALVGRDWVQTYNDELSASHLEHALQWATQTPRSPQAPLSCFEWSQIAQQTLQAYAKL